MTNRDETGEIVWRPPATPPVGAARVEDDRFLRGAARFIADVAVPGAAAAWMIRSPHAHARIGAMRTDAARRAPGVLAVLAASDAEIARLGAFPCEVKLVGRDGRRLVVPPRRAMAVDRARHAGEIVAMVVAETLDRARDAAELVEIDWQPLASATDPAAALTAGAPTIWDEAPGNLCFDWECGDAGATDAAFAAAAHVVRLTLRNNRICPAAMEPRGAIGIHDNATDSYTLHTSSQGSGYLKRTLAGPVLGIAPDRLRVVTPDVGGAFGAKLFPYPEQALVLVAARRTGRAVGWIADRTEAFLSDYAARDQVNEAELALDRDGRFLALRVASIANLGAGLSANAPHVPTTGSNKVLTGVYAIPAAHMRVRGAFTNTAPVEAYRGAGRPESIYVIERLVDRAARQLGMDPVALRRLNAVPISALPWRTPTGQVLHSVDFRRILDEGERRADRAGFARRRATSSAAGRLRGLGFSLHLHGTSGMPGERAAIEVRPDGSIVADTASQSGGQGHETVFARVVAELFAVPAGAVEVRQGDTAHDAPSGGTGGSGSLIVTSTALTRAARIVVARGRALAAAQFGLPEAGIEFADGRFRARGRNESFDVLELARLAGTSIAGAAEYTAEGPSFPTGCHACEVEIDTATGAVAIARFVAVNDVGRVVSPAIVAGQLHGGIAQGIGQALLEDCRYDPATGQLVSATLLDYALPRADDLPAIEIVLDDGIPCASNSAGVKGVGELGTIGAPPAVINAIADALGSDAIDMPATPERIWRLVVVADRRDR